jgi:polyhydroxyalkanoate synthase
MAGTFDLLRANDLIWSYVATNWLMGQKPPAFDILAWNADSTRMPAAMHSFYLRSCYRSNQLARGVMDIADTNLQVGDIAEDVYVLGAKEDHIAPWKSQYHTTQLLKSTRFVLSTSGHIAGIVNPPSPKAMYWTNDALPADSEAWLADATAHKGSWWEDWTEWISHRAGARRTPPTTGSPAHPALGPAPGTYVHSKA